MSARGYEHIHVIAESARQPLIPNGVMGMLIFVSAEAMLFAGLISAFEVTRSAAIAWPPLGQPRLPVGETLINTSALLLSGVMFYVARRKFRANSTSARTPLLISLLLGAFFVIFQGAEWVALVHEGLTLTSSTYGGFFYLIVGLHALHAIAALAVLTLACLQLQRGWLASSQLATAGVFWYFVVGLWPILYGLVYL
jgi:cytochrome c oxidase subunit 3